MKALKKFVDKMKPTFHEGGKLSAFRSVFDGFETFMFVPNDTARGRGAQIHDAIDSKRIMSFVVIALLPCMLFGMYNVGYQHYLAIGQQAGFWLTFGYGLIAVLPKIVVSYIIGLGIEFTVAQWKGEEIHEGFLVSGILIPLIVPINCPLWIIAVATAFAVIFAKEIFGGTGMNIFNVALVTRAFLFFSYPSTMSGDKTFVNGQYIDCISGVQGTADAVTCATPLGELGAGNPVTASFCDTITGFIPGSIGETSIIAIAIGAFILLWSGVASWKTMLSIFIGGGVVALLFNVSGTDNAVANLPWYEHLTVGGFAFGAVFMATDPVTSPRTESAKWVYGLLIGAVAILIRVLNPGYPEGMMLAILLMNVFAPLFDYVVVQSNINKRLKRVKK